MTLAPGRGVRDRRRAAVASVQVKGLEAEVEKLKGDLEESERRVEQAQELELFIQ